MPFLYVTGWHSKLFCLAYGLVVKLACLTPKLQSLLSLQDRASTNKNNTLTLTREKWSFSYANNVYTQFTYSW